MLPCAFGSGKLGTPFARMQLASRSSCRRTLSGVAGESPEAGRYFVHALNALWPAGDLRMPLPGRIWKPFRPGSGKFGTPFARMHWENRRPEALVALVEIRLGWPVDPQPAIATAPSRAMAIRSDLTRDLRIMFMAPRCTPAGVTAA